MGIILAKALEFGVCSSINGRASATHYLDTAALFMVVNILMATNETVDFFILIVALWYDMA